MAILEINLEKPALVEEYQYPGETTVGETAPGETHRGDADGGGSAAGKLVSFLVVLGGAAVLAWLLRRRGGAEQTDFEDFDTDQSREYEHGPEPEIGGDSGGGAKSKVASLLGLVVVVAAAAAVRKARSRK